MALDVAMNASTSFTMCATCLRVGGCRCKRETTYEVEKGLGLEPPRRPVGQTRCHHSDTRGVIDCCLGHRRACSSPQRFVKLPTARHVADPSYVRAGVLVRLIACTSYSPGSTMMESSSGAGVM